MSKSNKIAMVAILVIASMGVLYGVSMLIANINGNAKDGEQIPVTESIQEIEYETEETELLGSDGTTELFQEVSRKINLPASLEYAQTEPYANQSAVYIGEDFKIQATKNWLMNIDGNTVSMVHTAGPTMQISQSKITGDFTYTEVNNSIKTFLESCGIDLEFVEGHDVYMDGKIIGRMYSTLVKTDETLVLDAAIFMCGKEVYTLVSMYPSEYEEFTSSLYNAMSYKSDSIQLR